MDGWQLDCEIRIFLPSLLGRLLGSARVHPWLTPRSVSSSMASRSTADQWRWLAALALQADSLEQEGREAAQARGGSPSVLPRRQNVELASSLDSPIFFEDDTTPGAR